MLFEIKHRYSGAVLFSLECGSLKLCVEAAIGAKANLSDTYLRGAYLRDANLRGANLRGANLSDANLRDAYLRGANLSGAYLSGANLRGANLSDANLSGANLSDANLRGANLSGANLSGANLSDANLSALAPLVAVPSIHRRILAAIEGGGGTLDMQSWHKCETTHCRAGWAIHLAGKAGAVLEALLGPSAAGAIIHVASCPALEGKVPDFVASNDEALADIRRLAELEPELEAAV